MRPSPISTTTETTISTWSSGGQNRLLRNDGNGRFTDITDASGTGDRSNGNCVLPFDYNNDGLLDLYVCNYFPSVDLTHLETTRIMHESFEAARNGGANVLYKNLGGLRFENVARQLNVDDTGWSLDAGISDIDNDGDVDLYVANDFGQDKLYLSNGDGTFTDVTERAIGHDSFKGMNIEFGDFDEVGFTDGYVANITTAEYLKEGNMLLLNGRDGTFSNVAAATGTFDGGWGWCARFFDFDQDGHLDLFALIGFVSAGPQSYWEDLANIAVDPSFDPRTRRSGRRMAQRLSGHEPDRLFRNRGDGSFEEVAQSTASPTSETDVASRRRFRRRCGPRTFTSRTRRAELSIGTTSATRTASWLSRSVAVRIATRSALASSSPHPAPARRARLTRR
jgi:hypothetical protein